MLKQLGINQGSVLDDALSFGFFSYTQHISITKSFPYFQHYRTPQIYLMDSNQFVL